MRLGIFGGSFDPVHNGHLALARACQQQAALDEVWFVPTALQPLKQKGPHASNSQRVEMLNLAIEDAASEPGFAALKNKWRVCTLEIDRGGQSYTIDTLRQLHEELPGATLYFLIGSDALRDVARWKEPQEIFRLAKPLVVHRAGDPQPDLTSLTVLCTEETQPQMIAMPASHVSSSEIRRRVHAGESIEGLLPHAVSDYLAQHDLFRTTN